jgi:hypothetical protein
MDDPPLPGFQRVVIACRACGHQDELHLQISVERLRRVWRRCAACASADIAIMLIWEGAPAPGRANRKPLARGSEGS